MALRRAYRGTAPDCPGGTRREWPWTAAHGVTDIHIRPRKGRRLKGYDSPSPGRRPPSPKGWISNAALSPQNTLQTSAKCL